MLKTIIFSAFLFTATVTTATDKVDDFFILSGVVKASDNQTFYAPKTNNWRVQVQWMLPEGEVAEKGDLVVAFDGTTQETQIEQDKVSLYAATEELQRKVSTAEQKKLEAEFALKRTGLLLEKARVDAGISKEHLSEYDFQNNQLQLERAVVAHAKSKEALAQTKVENQVSVEKQKLTIKKLEQSISYNQSKLDGMSVYAERKGPVLYGMHPWNGEKVFVGMTAQPNWRIAEIPSVNGLYVEVWVHEVDVKYLKVNDVANLSFDAYPETKLVAKLTELSTQPEERQSWGKDVYYRGVFSFNNEQTMNLLPGMSAQLEL